MRCSTSNRAIAVFAVAVAILAVSQASAQLRIPASIISPLPSTCRVGPEGLSTGLIETAVTLDMPKVSQPVTHLHALAASDWVRLEGAALDNNLYTVTIRSKFSGDEGPASTVCSKVAWRPSRGPIVARDMSRGPGSIWQLEVTAGPKAAGRRLSLVRPSGSGVDPDAQVSTAALFALACESWSPEGPTVHRARGFATKVLIEVSPPPISSGFDPRQQAQVRAMILNAAALWVRACRECQAQHLAIVSIDGEDYVRGELARFLVSPDALVANQRPEATEVALTDALENNIFLRTGNGKEPRIKSLESYVAVANLGNARDRFCATMSDPSTTPVLSVVRTALCRSQDIAPHYRARIRFRLRPDGATFCGNDPDIIACRADNVLTELNTRDFRFRTGEESLPFGGGQFELDLLPVLVHEMGHWIGLPHVDQGMSIMAATADKARCIDEPTIAALQKGMESDLAGPMPFRLHGGPSKAHHTMRR